MERLTFGYGVPRRQVHAPHVPRPAPPPPEEQLRPIVADPLPGESSDWAYFGLLAFTALLFLRPQDQLPFLESFHLAELSAMVGLVAMGVKRLVRGLPVVHVTPELIGLLAFGFVLVATTPFSYWPGGSIEVITEMYLKVLLIVALMVNSLNTPLRLRRFTWLIILASAYISSRAVIDYLRGVNLVENGRVGGAIKGIFGNPNDLALNMVTFLPMAGLLALGGIRRARAMRARSRQAGQEAAAAAGALRLVKGTDAAPRPLDSSMTRLVAAAAAFLMLMAIVFTKSRGGALGLGAGFLAFVYYGRRLRPGLAGGALVLLVVLLPLLPSSFWARMGSITDPSEDPTGSREARRQVMIEAFHVFLERPLTGIGAGQFKNYNPPDKKERWREAHDVWLQVASETGIAGVLAFGYLVFAAFRAALWSKRRLSEFESGRRAGRRTPRAGPDIPSRPAGTVNDLTRSTDLSILRFEATALVPSLVGWFVCAIFASVAYNWTFYYLLGLCVATRELTRAALAARAVAADASGRDATRHSAVAG